MWLFFKIVAYCFFCVYFCFGVSTTRRSSHPWRLDLNGIVSEQLLRQIAQDSFPSILLHSDLVCSTFSQPAKNVHRSGEVTNNGLNGATEPEGLAS